MTTSDETKIIYQMKTIRVYRNPDCRRCARLARLGHLLDWRDRVEFSTETPKTGPLRQGEIVVEEFASGNFHRGAVAFDLIARQIPLYAPIRLLLRFSSFRRYIDRDLSGCGGASCEIRAATPVSPKRQPILERKL
jgi:hypothetical protein